MDESRKSFPKKRGDSRSYVLPSSLGTRALFSSSCTFARYLAYDLEKQNFKGGFLRTEKYSSEDAYRTVALRFTSGSDHAYRRRLLGALVLVLVLCIGLVRWWPLPEPSVEGPFRDESTERIHVKEVQPTRQTQELTPPPPMPLPPVVVPNNVVIEEDFEFGESKLDVEDPGEDAKLQEGNSDQATAARQPDTNARLFRAVQPEYPSSAMDDGIRARIEVAVEVTETGQVQEASIRNRWVLSESGRARHVADLEHGLEQAALAAARRSRFRPARANGKAVSTLTTITFEFGTEED